MIRKKNEFKFRIDAEKPHKEVRLKERKTKTVLLFEKKLRYIFCKRKKRQTKTRIWHWQRRTVGADNGEATGEYRRCGLDNAQVLLRHSALSEIKN